MTFSDPYFLWHFRTLTIGFMTFSYPGCSVHFMTFSYPSRNFKYFYDIFGCNLKNPRKKSTIFQNGLGKMDFRIVLITHISKKMCTVKFPFDSILMIHSCNFTPTQNRKNLFIWAPFLKPILLKKAIFSGVIP